MTDSSAFSPGHVFVVNGLTEHLLWDAAVVSTDRQFDIRPSWYPVLGGPPNDRWIPSEWSVKRSGQAPANPAVWFLDVARGSIGPLMEALAALLRDIADSFARGGDRAAVRSGRARPLIAVPTLGGGFGGHGTDKGGVVKALLRACERAVADYQIDIVVVARHANDYGAFQAARRRSARARGDLWAAPHSVARRIGSLARDQRLAVFFGAGLSMAAGLPSWSGLLASLGTDVDVPGLTTLGPLDQAELLSRRLGGALGTRVCELLEQQPYGHLHSLQHALLASTRIHETVTTNFDNLYEQALTDIDPGHPPVTLPSVDPVPAGRPWILKLHGSVEDPRSIVLTRGAFVRFAGRSGPLGAVLQSLMLTRHLLVVGASLTDDNVLRLAHEVLSIRKDVGAGGAIGTILTLSPQPALAALWEGQFDVFPVAPASASVSDAARELEVTLDYIGIFASSDTTYLLDLSYGSLLNDREREVAETARQFYLQASSIDHRQYVDGWKPITEMLRKFGAAAGTD